MVFFKIIKEEQISLSFVTSIIDGLKRLYLQKLKPLEVTYHFNDFVSPLLTNSYFDAKPMVMLLGQYSTGKTTFIKHLLKTSYLGAHIGPESTTNIFVVVMVLLAVVYKELRQAWRMPKSKLYRSTKIPRYHLKMRLCS
ncbi:EH domain-containing protein 1-like isoform X1 [Gossypium raimondii]|uniref:EH domain-containing protein 1-like isoform X1 n=1 Tax=Gossypium raimondii TaxID=29730 RepID=UPI00227B876A|nr:EH domain-containing protein 1-like isoform X1 [Gossypium raimondii]